MLAYSRQVVCSSPSIADKWKKLDAIPFDFRDTSERRPGMVKRIDRKTEPNRAAIYARVSDKSQDAEDKTSISEQLSDMEAHCQRRGLTIVARYQEVGRGWCRSVPVWRRPAYSETLDASTPSSAGSPTASAGACTLRPPSWRWSRRTGSTSKPSWTPST